jgi:hypothetical protein
MHMEEGHTAVYRTRLHWVMVLGPAVLMILSGVSIPAKGLNAVAFLALATLWGVFSSISLERSEFLVTGSLFLVRVGFPWRRSYTLPLADIERIKVYQPSLGKVLNFGKLTVSMKSRRRFSFRMLRDPLQLFFTGAYGSYHRRVKRMGESVADTVYSGRW